MSAPVIAPRSSWGPRFQDGDMTLSGLAVELFLHHTVTAHLGAGATVAAELAQMRHLEQIGQNRFGRGTSYNLVIFASGRAYQGVSWNRRGTHTGGRNSTSRSIAYAGNYEHDQLNAAQINMTRAVIAYGRGRWWTAGAPIRTHRDVSATACPGRNVVSRLDEIRRPGAALPDDDELEEEDDMPVIIQSPGRGIWLLDGGTRTHFGNLDDVHAMVRAGLRGPVPVSDQFVDAIPAPTLPTTFAPSLLFVTAADRPIGLLTGAGVVDMSSVETVFELARVGLPQVVIDPADYDRLRVPA